MIRKNLVQDNEKETTVKEIGVFPRADEMRVLSNPVAWKIVKLLFKTTAISFPDS